MGWNTGQERAKPESQVALKLTCERPGEGAGWGLEGDPVIGCGALFISWGSAWGGRCGPVYESKKNKKQGEMLKVFADTQYKIVTCSLVAMRPNVQVNIVVSFHTNLLRTS